MNATLAWRAMVCLPLSVMSCNLFLTSLLRTLGYISASIDLAHEYVKLGKMKRAAMIFNLALEVVRNRQASPEVSSAFLLRFAESLALIEDVSRRYDHPSFFGGCVCG